MKQQMKATIKQEQTLTHQLSMKLMMIGQTLLEIEHDYFHCLSRSMQERVRQAVEELKDLSSECMTELTRNALTNWERKREEFAKSEKYGWELWTEEEQKKWKNERKRLNFFSTKNFKV